MNLFEPPTDERRTNEPVTLKRLGWSVSRGVFLGVGLAAILFAMAWAGKLFERDEYDPWGFLLLWALPLGALEFWAAANVFRSNRVFALFARIVAIALGLGAAVYIYKSTSALQLTEWARAHPEFVTLVVVCALVGLLAVRGGLRLWAHHRGRALLWFSAAVAIWSASEWAVKLGAVADAWRDPRADLAFNTIIVAGVLAAVGVLALMDWRMRQREAQELVEDAPSKRSGLNNG